MCRLLFRINADWWSTTLKKLINSSRSTHLMSTIQLAKNLSPPQRCNSSTTPKTSVHPFAQPRRPPNPQKTPLSTSKHPQLPPLHLKCTTSTQPGLTTPAKGRKKKRATTPGRRRQSIITFLAPDALSCFSSPYRFAHRKVRACRHVCAASSLQ